MGTSIAADSGELRANKGSTTAQSLQLYCRAQIRFKRSCPCNQSALTFRANGCLLHGTVPSSELRAIDMALNTTQCRGLAPCASHRYESMDHGTVPASDKKGRKINTKMFCILMRGGLEPARSALHPMRGGLEPTRSTLHPMDQLHVGLVHLLQKHEGDDGVRSQPENKFD